MGHIVEKDEEVDWKTFYAFGIPPGISDAQWRKVIGNRAWKIIHGAIDNYPCSTCREPGKILFDGVHDLVNLHLDKPLFHPETIEEFFAMIHEGEKRYRATRKEELPKVLHRNGGEVTVQH